MEKRVIKFNLVGAIFVIILIILTIVGIVIIATKPKNNNDNFDSNNQLEQNNDIDENKEIKADVMIQGTKREIIMKTCKGSYGYTMQYDIISFYVEKDVNGVDKFNSLYSDTVNISVLKSSGIYEEEIEKLRLNSNTMITNNINITYGYEIEEKVINGLKVNIKIEKNTNEKINTYYIKSYDGYFVVQVNCGLGFEDMLWPVIEKMIETFEIL